jgi:hypothetical protein
MAAMVVNAGKAIIAAAMKYTSGTQTEPRYVGWGTSATAEAATQTDLQAAATEARTAGTSSLVTTTVTNDTYQVVGTITCAGAGKSIQEVGLFDAAGSGSPPSGANMLCRSVHGVQTLNVGDAIEYTVGVRQAG